MLWILPDMGITKIWKSQKPLFPRSSLAMGIKGDKKAASSKSSKVDKVDRKANKKTAKVSGSKPVVSAKEILAKAAVSC